MLLKSYFFFYKYDPMFLILSTSCAVYGWLFNQVSFFKGENCYQSLAAINYQYDFIKAISTLEYDALKIDLIELWYGINVKRELSILLWKPSFRVYSVTDMCLEVSIATTFSY